MILVSNTPWVATDGLKDSGRCINPYLILSNSGFINKTIGTTLTIN